MAVVRWLDAHVSRMAPHPMIEPAGYFATGRRQLEIIRYMA